MQSLRHRSTPQSHQFTWKTARFLLLLWLFLSGATLPNSVAADKTLKDELLREAPKVWREYLERFRTVKFTYSRELYDDGKLQESEPPTTFYIQYPYALVEINNDGKVEGYAEREIFARNKKYSFKLALNDAKEYEISYVKENEKRLYNQYDYLDHRRNPKDYDSAIVQSVTSCFGLKLEPKGIFLPPFLDDDLFQIIDVEEVYEGDLREYKVQFEYSGTEPHFSSNLLRRGTVYLLPDHMWVVKKVDIIENGLCDIVDGKEVRLDVHVVTTIEYDFSKSTIPLPVSIEDTIPDKICGYNNLRIHYDLNFDPTFTGLNEKECYLSHYGFPEPKFTRSHTALRATIVACGFFLLYLAFRNWNRRRKSQFETVDSETNAEIQQDKTSV